MPPSPPLISVVLPAYNHEAFVQEAIASVLQQNFSDFELIIINDGSTDGTAEAIAAISDPRIRVYHQANAGSHAAINRGLSLAQGEYISILNSDDRYHPDRLAILLALAQQRRPTPTFAITALQMIDGQGKRIEDPQNSWFKMYQKIFRHWEKMQPDVTATLLRHNIAISTSNFFFDRRLIAEIGIFRPFRYVLDWEYALRVALHHPECLVFLADQALLDYRIHGSNTISTGAIRSRAEAIHLLQSALATRYPGVIPTLEELHIFRRFIRQKQVSQIQYQAEHNANLLKIEIHHGIVRYEDEVGKHQLTAAQLQKTEAQYIEKNQELQSIYQSKAWRWGAPLRWLERKSNAVRRYGHLLKKTTQKHQFHRALFLLGQTWSREGLSGVKKLLNRQSATEANPTHTSDSAYAHWLAQEAITNQSLRENAPQIIAALPSRPVFSIITPAFNTDPALLQAMLASVQAQYYPHWQLCLCDDASESQETRDILAAAMQEDSRIQLHQRTENGHIVAATNDALRLATGDYVVFLDHDDRLAPQALLRLAQTIAEHPEIDVLYSDEDKLDDQGNRVQPFFKPDWSPALLFSQNYVCHLLCVRRTLMQQCGGLKAGMEGSQDHDLILRLSEHTTNIHHLPEILYHWRMHPSSTAMNAQAKPYAHEAGCKAVTEHLARRYPTAFKALEETPFLFTYSPRFKLPEETKASIIIPTKDKVDLLAACIQSIREKSSWPHFEIIILDNNSTEPATFDYLKAISAEDPRIQVIPAPIPFNWSRLNNLGAKAARGDVLIFLNNDTAVISPDWLERLMERALLPDVGTVGAQLLYQDGTLQHVGVVVGMGGWADHLYKGLPLEHASGPFVSRALSRNVLANTGACLAIERKKFEALGSFNEDFIICGSDVELGIRAHRQKLQNIYLATVQLYHYESKTRGTEVPESDFKQSALHYAPYRLEGDPFYNPNLSRYLLMPTPQYPSP